MRDRPISTDRAANDKKVTTTLSHRFTVMLLTNLISEDRAKSWFRGLPWYRWVGASVVLAGAGFWFAVRNALH